MVVCDLDQKAADDVAEAIRVRHGHSVSLAKARVMTVQCLIEGCVLPHTRLPALLRAASGWPCCVSGS